jgi:hypothetical protein
MKIVLKIKKENKIEYKKNKICNSLLFSEGDIIFEMRFSLANCL